MNLRNILQAPSLVLLVVSAWLLPCHLSANDVDMVAVNTAREAFVERMVSRHGFDADALHGILSDAQIDSRVLAAISRPAERVVPWHEYRLIFVTDERIAAGVDFWREHEALISATAREYGVDPEMLVSILGVETYFGRRMGTYRVLDSLYTLAFAYPPRSTFFTSELENFLLLGQEESVDVFNALGSYAGAMGAGQFISSSYRAYAVDGSGNGRRDLWNDWQDILASVANYFRVHGWRAGESVADQATRSARAGDHSPSNGLDLDQTVQSLSELGYVFATDMPGSAAAAVYAVDGVEGTEYWVGYHNFYVITRYNRSHMYALAVHELSQALREAFDMAAGRTAEVTR
jgi:membrane-bound lytic murein transglycosylase B